MMQESLGIIHGMIMLAVVKYYTVRAQNVCTMIRQRAGRTAAEAHTIS